MRSLYKRAALSVCIAGLALGSGWSQAQPSPDPVSQEARAARRTEAEKAVAESLQRRSVRKVAPKVVAADARRIVSALSEAQVEALLEGDELVSVLTDERLRTAAAEEGPTPAADKALGDAETELLFIPVEPCRIIDTRKPGAGGPLAAGETRDFEVAGTANFDPQGGKTGGCGIPLGAANPEAPAVAINFIAVGPAGAGNLRAWEFGQPIPTASVLNYANVPGLNIANGTVVPIAGVSTLEKDLHIRADVSGTHVVADVTGYFTRFPVEELQGGLKTSLFTGFHTTIVDLSDGGCKNLVSTCTVSSSTAGTVLVEAWAQVVVNHTSGTLDRFVMQIETTDPVTCPEDDTINASDYEIPSALGTNVDVDFTLSHGRTFTQTAGQTVTYRLSGKMTDGAGSLDKVENSRLFCTFIPN